MWRRVVWYKCTDVSGAWAASVTKVKEAACSSGKWVDFYQNIGRYIPEDSKLHSNSCEAPF